METFKQILADSAAAMDIELNDTQIAQCEAFARLVVEWNERMNLTTLVEPEEMALKHFIDSMVALRAGTWPTGSRGIDVGTGAGFPGIPLAILRPDMHWLLADALNKRIEFLRIVTETLGLEQVRCVHARAEELGRQADIREQCDVAVARAVARMPVLLEYCVPLVRHGGGFLAMKGPDGEAELAEGAKAAKILGCAEPQVIAIDLPRAAGARTLIWYPKAKSTPKAYPRRSGTPGKNPL